jgi:hypothetical protein
MEGKSGEIGRLKRRPMLGSSGFSVVSSRNHCQMTGKYAKRVGDADRVRGQRMGLVVSECPIYMLLRRLI